MNYEAAIKELETQRDHCNAAITALRKLATRGAAPEAAEPKRGRRKGTKLSAEARARIGEGQRKRWERVREANSNGAQPTAEIVQ